MLPQFNDTEIAFKHQSNQALRQAHFIFRYGQSIANEIGHYGYAMGV